MNMVNKQFEVTPGYKGVPNCILTTRAEIAINMPTIKRRKELECIILVMVR